MAYEDDDNNLVRDLREQIETLSKDNKSLRKVNEELSTKARKETVGSLIKERSLNPKIEALIPKDVDDVAAWLDEFGDLFGVAPATESAGDDAGADAEVNELDRQNDSEQSGAEDSGLLAKIESTTDFAELAQLINGG